MDLVRYLWSAQLLTNPWGMAAVLALIAACCLLAARKAQLFSRFWRWSLAVLSVCYLFVLVQPVGGWEHVGQHDRDFTLNPVTRAQSEREEALTSADETGMHRYETSDGRSVYSDSSGVLTLSQIRQLRSEMDPEEALYDVYRTVSSEGEIVWYGPAGEELLPDDITYLEEQVREGESQSTRQSLLPEQNMLNFLLFVPVGVIAVLALSSWPLRLLAGPTLSLAVEALQWVLATGRASDTADLVANSSGALVGVALMAGALYIGTRRSALPENR